LRPGQWQRLELHLAAGRLSVSLDGQVLDSRDVMGPAGALLLAKRAGDDPVVLALDGLEIR
ncbi:MAG: hypothetical protein HUU35_11975, partial [Armatimonadetes bacterium]|nr:hypothetical protein [Armatimonadota bacterium]